MPRGHTVMKAKPVKCIAVRTEHIPAAGWYDRAEQGQLTRSSHPMLPKSGSGRGLREFQGVPVLRSGVWTWAFWLHPGLPCRKTLHML